MNWMSLSAAALAPLCACLTLLPGYSTRERLLAFVASAIVLACALFSVLRAAA